jgi:SET domain-containing protein
MPILLTRTAVRDRPPVVIRAAPGKGRGAFADRPLAAGEVLERAPVLELSDADLERLHATALDDYLFHWPHDGNPHEEALAFGLVCLANHSSRPNTRIHRLLSERLIEWVTVRTVAAGEELTFAYRCGAWFEER